MAVAIGQAYVDMINSFREQCKEFIIKFKEQGCEEFSAFAKMFVANRFSLTYEKYADSYFIREFKEDSLQIAKHIMLENNFIGGLYMIYGLYFIQDTPKQTVRLEREEFEKIKEHIQLSKPCEPGIVFAKLLLNEAFSITRFTREFSIERLPRTRLVNGNHTLVKNKSLTEEWLNSLLQDSNIGDDLKRIDEQISALKEKLAKEHSIHLDDLTGDTISGLIKNLTEDTSTSQHVPEDTSTSQHVPDDIGARRRKLKERPMMKRGKNKRNDN